MFGLVEIVMLKTGQRIHDLKDSFNIVVQGTIRDEMEERDYGQFCAIADWPIQININDPAKPILGKDKNNKTKADLLQGKSMKDTLLLIATQETFIIRLTKQDGEKIPQVFGLIQML